ncbi:Uncharacterized protein APZ42_026149 [Daphnia magna]|uniref:Reverse transcriptase domain-containing protein n=1 Tax=Daphnia magna TaxID=35525 RepID=A0A162EDX1_9CRUS|nr:Uncharacterized protein APZ42_026149 [Daphnia magna]
MTTFSTPFGRYMYHRLPFGVCHAGDDYSRRVSAVFDDIPNCRRIIEDILIFSETYEEHVSLVKQVFQRAADIQIAINTSKIKFAQPSVLFGGYILSSTGFRPNPELLSAISRFPNPTNITEMRAFHGLCQQMGNFSDNLAAALAPLAPPPKKEFPLGMDNTARSHLQRCPLRTVVFRRAIFLRPSATHGPSCRCLPPERSRFHPPSVRSRWEMERGPGRVTFSIRRGDTLRHDRAGVPGRSMGYAEVPAIFGRPPIIPPIHGSSAAHPDPKRLQLRQTRQPADSSPESKNAALCVQIYLYSM